MLPADLSALILVGICANTLLPSYYSASTVSLQTKLFFNVKKTNKLQMFGIIQNAGVQGIHSLCFSNIASMSSATGRVTQQEVND